MKCFLITGVAGFIGSHLADRLLNEGHEVIGIDNFDDFYDKSIKLKNLINAKTFDTFRFIELNILEIDKLSLGNTINCVIHLAAKAGVRPSILNPSSYVDVNIKGTQTVLEFIRINNIPKIVFASSSSVYGINQNYPWCENDNDLKPISPYASTKMACELIGHVYSHLYNISFIGLRFFTVFGPRQRPDLAINKFIRNTLEGKSIPFFGDGTTQRDYTYIDDIIEGILSSINYETKFEIFNLGNNEPITLVSLINLIENVTGKVAKLKKLPMQEGDVPITCADISKAKKELGYNPKTSIREGLIKYKKWIDEETYIIN